VNTAFDDYAVRLPRNWRFSLTEIPTGGRGRRRGDDARQAEGDTIIAELAESERMIALDERGRQPDSVGLSQWLSDWQADGRDVCLVIGGPDGLSAACLQRAERSWSLSNLTLPHGLVRILLVEQLYRAWSLQTGHPYHRA
jgi:23S rRNA (pseudouridine1915-N3)-methyltransferase